MTVRPSAPVLAWIVFMEGLQCDLGLGLGSRAGEGGRVPTPELIGLVPLLCDPASLGASAAAEGARAADAAAREVLGAARVCGLRLLTATLLGLATDGASAPSTAMLPLFRADAVAAVAAAADWMSEDGARSAVMRESTVGGMIRSTDTMVEALAARVAATTTTGMTDESCALLMCCDELLCALLLLTGPAEDVTAWLVHVRRERVQFAGGSGGSRDEEDGGNMDWPFVVTPGQVTLVLARTVADVAARREQGDAAAGSGSAASGADDAASATRWNPVAAYREKLQQAILWQAAARRAIPPSYAVDADADEKCGAHAHGDGAAGRMSWHDVLCPCSLSRHDALALVRCRYELHAEPYPPLDPGEQRAAGELRAALHALQ